MKDLALAIESALESTLKGVGDVPKPFLKALQYSVFPGGKRIRPRMALLLCKDLGGLVDDLVPVSQSLELVHCASLVHDDLPALDNDDYRRGKPAVHKAFGEANAVLLGDFMIPLAFSCIIKSAFSADRKNRLCNSLASAFSDICHGQVRDMLPKNTSAELELTHRLKTGALFRAAAEYAAISSSDEPEIGQVASSLGMEIGFCFQIVDDFIDAFGTDNDCGRPAGSDARNLKQTFFSTMTKEGGLQYLEEASVKVDSCFKELEVVSHSSLPETKALFKSVVARAGL